DTIWTKTLSPTYDDYTKTFTFLFNNPDDNVSSPFNNDKLVFSVSFKREIKDDDEGKSIICIKLYSFTIEAWKLCYILDGLKFNIDISSLKKGFRYDRMDW
ncbi:5310_t:CDS:2, partial [Dentiscutata erythropus]